MRVLIRYTLSVLAVCTLLTFQAAAQRHGRADSVLNYTNSMRPIDAELALNLMGRHWMYVHLSEVRQMQRATLQITDPHTHKKMTYEGVQLRTLVPENTPLYRFEVFTESWDFRDKHFKAKDDFDPALEPVIADTVNGRKMGGQSPFYFVTLSKSGSPIVIKKLAFVKILTEPESHVHGR